MRSPLGHSACQATGRLPRRLRCPHASPARPADRSQLLHFGGHRGSRLRLRCPDSTVLPPPQQLPNTPHDHSSNPPVLFFLKKKKKKEKDPTKQKQGSCLAPAGAGHASWWAGPSSPGRLRFVDTSLGVGGANRGKVKRRRVSQQSERKVRGRPRAPPPAGAEGLSTGLRSQPEVVSTAHSGGERGQTPVPAVRQPKPSRTPWRPRVWRRGGVAAAAVLGPAVAAGRRED